MVRGTRHRRLLRPLVGGRIVFVVLAARGSESTKDVDLAADGHAVQLLVGLGKGAAFDQRAPCVNAAVEPSRKMTAVARTARRC